VPQVQPRVRSRRRSRGKDEQGVSDEAFWAFMKGDQ
jgi:hypothetical protein